MVWVVVTAGLAAGAWGCADFLAGLLAVAAAVGALETVADAAFVLAAGDGRLGLAAMLASLYPAVTVLLNAYILGERLHLIHGCGVATALFAIACLAG
ncbi:hypothetical protein [Catenuloplanes atrovinosus]|uniref:Drug/metabolite transporter (DMT)-like permease n=1 Tax=Catenuloplanes atrovinosus TaxID=137266 RepID=A0AAE3YV55_9ACTN|nr:hypothetical protein [Catenuloplanes atrovinosus]MDR7279226.1 drug/metabolite transporter (DMT)-like permease [Catenuloplanes atrovinosus]